MTAERETRRLRLATPWPASSEETAGERAFLQERLCRFFKVVTLLASAFFLASNLIPLALSGGMRLQGADAFQALSPLVFAACWLATSWRRLSHPVLRGLDTSAILLGYLPLAAQAVLRGGWPAHFPSLLALTNLLCARAVFVPSTLRRSALLGGAASLLAVAASFGTRSSFTYVDVEVGWAESTAFAATWCALAVAVSSVGSRVIFGLRREVVEARRLGQYTLERRLASGGMGDVFLARHAMLRRPTAVKVLPPEKACQVDHARFEREVQLTSELTHPNTIAIYDYGRTPEGLFYYAMEHVDGLTLRDLVTHEGPVPPGRVIHALTQACGSLAEAHDRALVHRDVKPENLMLCERGGVPDVLKVLDFGLVRDLQDAEVSGSAAITGTPLYMAPEMISSPDAASARSDLYALGAVAYLLLSGRPVFEASNPIEALGHHLHLEPVPPSKRDDVEADIPSDLEAIVMRCLAKDPAGRPADARALAEALAACAAAGTWTEADARRWWSDRWPALRREPPPGEAGPATRSTDLTGPLDRRRPA